MITNSINTRKDQFWLEALESDTKHYRTTMNQYQSTLKIFQKLFDNVKLLKQLFYYLKVHNIEYHAVYHQSWKLWILFLKAAWKQYCWSKTDQLLGSRASILFPIWASWSSRRPMAASFSHRMSVGTPLSLNLGSILHGWLGFLHVGLSPTYALRSSTSFSDAFSFSYITGSATLQSAKQKRNYNFFRQRLHSVIL